MDYKFHKDGAIPTQGEIFVFGSNIGGRHGKGSALAAKEHFGAIYGQGFGLQGQSYAIPTKDGRPGTPSLRDPRSTLPLAHIKRDIDTFIKYAEARPEQKFFIVRLGCDLAAHKNSDIAPLFAGAPLNCIFPEEWEEFLRPTCDDNVGNLLEADSSLGEADNLSGDDVGNRMVADEVGDEDDDGVGNYLDEESARKDIKVGENAGNVLKYESRKVQKMTVLLVGSARVADDVYVIGDAIRESGFDIAEVYLAGSSAFVNAGAKWVKNKGIRFGRGFRLSFGEKMARCDAVIVSCMAGDNKMAKLALTANNRGLKTYFKPVVAPAGYVKPAVARRLSRAVVVADGTTEAEIELLKRPSPMKAWAAKQGKVRHAKIQVRRQSALDAWLAANSVVFGTAGISDEALASYELRMSEIKKLTPASLLGVWANSLKREVAEIGWEAALANMEKLLGIPPAAVESVGGNEEVADSPACAG